MAGSINTSYVNNNYNWEPLHMEVPYHGLDWIVTAQLYFGLLNDTDTAGMQAAWVFSMVHVPSH